MQPVDNLTESEVSANIVERILTKDPQAEQEMVLRYQRGLNAMLYNSCKDKALAEDVAQDTWLLVLQKVRDSQLKDHKRLAAFIIQIAKNQLIMKFRARDKYNYAEQDEAFEIEDQAHTPEQRLVNQQLAASIVKVLDGLRKPRDRELIHRFYLVGDEKSLLCKEYDLTEAHFDRVLYRARERFKTILVDQSKSSESNDI